MGVVGRPIPTRTSGGAPQAAPRRTPAAGRPTADADLADGTARRRSRRAVPYSNSSAARSNSLTMAMCWGHTLSQAPHWIQALALPSPVFQL